MASPSPLSQTLGSSPASAAKSPTGSSGFPFPGPADHLPHTSQPYCLWPPTQQEGLRILLLRLPLDEAPCTGLSI